jgi:quercetin dioxygenase-like cupin family protein
MTSSDDRLRTPPSTRFAGPEHKIDFSTTLAKLRQEPHPGKDGHRQVTIFHSDTLRLVLFAFEAGGCLPRHHAPGVVAIQALRGELRVSTPDEIYELTEGQVVVLDPGVPHDVDATGEADMLLSIAMAGPRSAGPE